MKDDPSTERRGTSEARPSRRDWLLGSLAAPFAAQFAGCGSASSPEPKTRRPNILFAISDDISWLHKSAYGDPVVKTPAFDRVAREGVLFTHSFCAAPSCTPSRSAVLTGQDIWRLESAGMLLGTFPSKFDVYPRMLEAAGYFVGYTGKGWGPGNLEAGGRHEDPVGKAFQERRHESVPEGINPIDYAANFEAFIEARPADAPFCFWFGATEAHRPSPKGLGAASGKKRENVKLPAFLPDAAEIRSDFLDYYFEIEWFDEQLGRMIETLERNGELDNTLVVVTSDNGIAIPRAKTTLYDWGVRMPLAIRWPDRVPGGRVIDDFVSHTDFAPTFLEAAGVERPPAMTGRSLLEVLVSSQQGIVDSARDKVVTAIERHTWCRPNGALYPVRAIRTRDFLYIHNYEPDRWPAGDPDFDAAPQGFFGDVDRCPTKTFLLEPGTRSKFPREYDLCLGKRPEQELYEVAADPAQVNNLAAHPDYAEVRQRLRAQLDAHLAETGDPRAEGKSPWDEYEYYGRK